MTRGKRWSVEEERMLEQFVKAGVSVVEIAKRIGRSAVAVHDKISHLGLEDDQNKWCGSSSSPSSSSPSIGVPVADVARDSAAKISPVESLGAEKSSAESSAPVLVWPEALDTPEDAMRTVAAAVLALKQPGLGRNEISRLKSIVLGAEKFQGLYDWAAQSRRLEERLVELEGKYFELGKKQTTTKNDESS